MLIKGRIKYKNALIVNKELLQNMDRILSKYYDNICYNTTLRNGDIIDYDSLEELVSYDNYGKRKIKNLRMYSLANFSIDFDLNGLSIHSYSSTVLGNYSIKNYDDSIIIENKLLEEIKKYKQPWYCTLFSKISIVYFLIFLTFLIVLANLITLANHNSTKDNMSISEYVNVTFIGTAIILGVSYFCSRIRDALFPPLIFYWGHEIEKYNELKGIRTQIFWGVIIASMLPIVPSLIKFFL
ncbi:hypothetical protein [Anaeromicropila herbilytica]|uniref:Uncharacterized protein n=1 Tax=Anaeromicropila herbilytica TaxID=2785025 RepID=A0A7R7EP70_9FIRM|nr:hypothetical protein [Anaeromicropila herbilytica]BCN32087.1 hypothetical protein bsdtb5_33820 [Anaeromicropila herbilytica]